MDLVLDDAVWSQFRHLLSTFALKKLTTGNVRDQDPHEPQKRSSIGYGLEIMIYLQGVIQWSLARSQMAEIAGRVWRY
jgi:hypothetical protein